MEDQMFNLFLFKTVFLPLNRALCSVPVLQRIAYDQY